MVHFDPPTGGGGWNPLGGAGDVLNGALGALNGDVGAVARGVAAGQAGADAVSGAVGAVNSTVSYWSDPWGNTFQALKGAAAGMSKDVLPALTSATLPDLNATWFLNAYRVSFATAIFVMVALLIPQVVRTARGTLAGRELLESMSLYSGIFLAGAMFGPALGIVLVNFFHSLSNVFVSFGVTGSVNSIVSQFQTMINGTNPVGITGGVPVAVFLMLCMIVGLFMAIVILMVQLVTLYFAGMLFPLGLVWIVDPTKRKFGMRIAGLWFGILAAHPLLFLLLGFAFSMMANQVGAFGNNLSLKSLVTLVVAVIALFMAALSPLLLMKFAPILPMASGGTNGPSLNAPSIGSPSVGDAARRLGQPNTSTRKAKSASDNPVTDESPVSTGGSPTLSEAFAAKNASTSAPKGGGGAATSGARSAGAAASAEAGAATSAGTTAASAAAAGAGSGAGTAAAGMAAAGAAESATGVGLVVGIPTLIAAATASAAAKTASMTKRAGEHATGAMDDAQIGRNSTS